MGGGGLEKGSVDGHERLFIACSRDRRTVIDPQSMKCYVINPVIKLSN